MIAQTRGYCAIQNMFLDKFGKCDFKKVNKFKDNVGIFITEAINEKIERDK